MRMTSRRPDLGRAHHALALAGVLALATAACGGGTTGDTATTAPTEAAPSVEATVTPEATPTVTTVQVGQEAWFAGFHISFGAAKSTILPERGGTVAIEAMFENTGVDGATLDATLNLASGGENASESFDMDLPNVPGGTTGKGTFAFDVEASFSFDDAVLTLGRPDNQQAVVPLTPAAGDAVTLEPVAVAVTGSASAGDLELTVDGGELRADKPDRHGQMEAGTLAFTIRYDATFTSDFAGGFAFSGENVALRLPDGTTVAAIQDGRSQSIELIPAASTVRDLFTRFEVEDPAAGDYVLLVRSFGDEGELAFTVP